MHPNEVHLVEWQDVQGRSVLRPTPAYDQHKTTATPSQFHALRQQYERQAQELRRKRA